MPMPKVEIEVDGSEGAMGAEGAVSLGERITSALGEQLAEVVDAAEAAQVLRDLADIVEEGGMAEPMEG